MQPGTGVTDVRGRTVILEISTATVVKASFNTFMSTDKDSTNESIIPLSRLESSR